MHYYKRHIGDYLKNTSHLSLLEHGVYSRILDVYYTTEHPIKETDKYRCVAARTKAEKGAVDTVLSDFFTLEDGLWRLERCEKEITQFQNRAKRNAQNGKAGGRPSGF